MKNLFASDKMEPYNEIGLIFDRAYFVKGLREEVNLMCNLSEGIEERAAEKAAEKTLRETNKKVITNMHRKGYTLEQIAEIVEIKSEEVKKIIEEESMTV